MGHVRCESCGRETDVPKRTASLRCPHCDAWLRVLPWRRLWALEELETRIQTDMELPQDLKLQVAELVALRLEKQRARLQTAAATEAEEAERDRELERQALAAAPEPSTVAREDLVSAHVPAAPRPPPKPAPTAVKKKPTKREPARGPTVWERLGPAFAENLGFGLAAFLILAGAVYFTTTAWTTMSDEHKLLVVVGGLFLLGVVLLGASRLLNRSGNLPEVERTLLLVVAFLVPIAAIPAGTLFGLSTWRALLASGVVLIAGWFAVRRLAHVLDPALSPFLPIVYPLLSALALVGGPVGRASPLLGALGVSLLLLGAVWIYAWRVVPRLRKGRWAGLWPAILLAFAATVAAGHIAVAGRLTFQMDTLLAAVGIVVAALGAALATAEPALSARRVFGRRRPAVVLVVAIALGITGTLMAVGDPTDVGLFLASALGAYACVRAGLALPVPWFALPGLAISALSYLHSPAPVRSHALRLRDQAAAALDYIDRPMPPGWYGITFLPYVFACAWIGWALLKRGHVEKARVFLAWTFLAATGLSVLALFGSEGDLRVPAAVFVAQGGLLLAIGVALRHRWFALSGTLAIFGGAACAILYLEPAAAVVVLALSAVGLLAVVAAARLARAGAEALAPVRAGLLDASALLAFVLVVVATIDTLRLMPAPMWHGLGYLLLTVLVAAVSFALRRPEGIALAGLALGAAAVRIVTGLAPEAGGDTYFLAFAAVSGLVLLTPRIDALLPESLRHPSPAAPASIGSWTPLGAMAVQLYGFVLLVAHMPDPGWTLTLAAGLLVASFVLARAATRETQPWPLYPAVLELVAAGIVTGTALTACPWYGTAGLAGAAGALVLICVPLWMSHPRVLLGGLTLPLRHLLPVLVALFAVWAAGLVVAWWRGHPECMDGWLLAGASGVVALAVRAALARNVPSHALRAAALYAGTLFAPAAAGLLIAFGAAPHAWSLAFVGAAIAVWIWAGPDRRLYPPAVLHLLLALGIATWFVAEDAGDPQWHLAAFLLVAAGGRIAARRQPTFGWTLLLVSLLLGISIALYGRILETNWSLQPAIWLTFAALAYASLRVRVLGVNETAVRIVADPILAAGVAGALLHAFQVLVSEPPTNRPADAILPSVRWLRLGEGALALAALARSLALPFPSLGRRTLAFFVLGVAAFAFAPVNMWIHGGDFLFWRPDVEVALLAILLAWTMPLAVKARLPDGTGDLGARVTGPMLLALFGVALTFAQLRDLSTPLTLLAATVSFLVLLLRDRGPLLAGLTATGVLVTTLAFASWWQPMPGSVQEGVLLLYAAVSALVAPVLGVVARSLAREGRPDWLRRAGRETYPVAILAAVLAFGFVVGDLAVNHGTPATPLEVLLAAIGLAVPGAAALWGAMRAGRPHLVHVALLAGLLFYSFLVQRTEALAFLDGFHLHALVVIGASLVFLSGFHRGSLGRWLAVDGLALSAPAAVRYVPEAFGLGVRPEAASSALAFAAVSFAAGARRLRWPGLYAVAAVLVNLMLFSFWQRHSLFDPPFYGIPAGLTLLGAAMLLRGKISSAASLALVVPGLALLYGSVAMQVVDAESPLPALLLFGLGLATVVLGFLFHRNAWIVVGVVVIVLDVVVYLLVHGFEQGFFSAALLVVSGLVVMAVAALASARRRKREAPDA